MERDNEMNRTLFSYRLLWSSMILLQLHPDLSFENVGFFIRLIIICET